MSAPLSSYSSSTSCSTSWNGASTNLPALPPLSAAILAAHVARASPASLPRALLASSSISFQAAHLAGSAPPEGSPHAPISRQDPTRRVAAHLDGHQVAPRVCLSLVLRLLRHSLPRLPLRPLPGLPVCPQASRGLAPIPSDPGGTHRAYVPANNPTQPRLSTHCCRFAFARRSRRWLPASRVRRGCATNPARGSWRLGGHLGGRDGTWGRRDPKETPPSPCRAHAGAPVPRTRLTPSAPPAARAARARGVKSMRPP